ncbi:MAG: ABC transporter permease [Sandaracinaceae bacterium]
MRRADAGNAVATAGGALLVLVLVLPVLALLLGVRPEEVQAAVRSPLLVRALALSLTTTAVSVALVGALGTPLAWWLGRSPSGLAQAVHQAVRLPVVTPPAVAGVALLSAFGRRGLLGPWLEGLGVGVAFTPVAVVIAQVFVAAPFFVLPAAATFRALDEELLLVARSLGASPLSTALRVGLPLALPSLVGALAVAWARALGEFGATLVFAGNLAGRTQTLPLAIYTSLESDLGVARVLSVVLLAVAAALFFGLGRRAWSR